MSIENDDVPQLSAETFLALQEFYKEQELREAAGSNASSAEIAEDWQLSQFWYNLETIDTLMRVAIGAITNNKPAKIALISCPSLYKRLRNESDADCIVHLYEYDKRFAIFGSDFTFYDYKSPLHVPQDRRASYDLVIADPPFLSDECLTKVAVTIKYLTRNKIILCTGATMEALAHRLLAVNKTQFEPRHQNNLANEFRCFTNFDIAPFL